MVSVLVTSVGNFPVPPEMAELMNGIRFKPDGWPDMRTRAGKKWAEMFRSFEDEKINAYFDRHQS